MCFYFQRRRLRHNENYVAHVQIPGCLLCSIAALTLVKITGTRTPVTVSRFEFTWIDLAVSVKSLDATVPRSEPGRSTLYLSTSVLKYICT